MTPRQETDKVSHIVQLCIANHELAEKVYQAAIAEKSRNLHLPEGTVSLSEQEHGELVQRFSSEVEPTIWESKRAKR